MGNLLICEMLFYYLCNKESSRLGSESIFYKYDADTK